MSQRAAPLDHAAYSGLTPTASSLAVGAVLASEARR
jgi:hypothetical protein